MALTLHNTLSRTKEAFVPIDPSHVRMYVCGPTVYDYAHIGNARPIVVFDVLYRLLRSQYPRVTYVRNITDIDDKIIERAKANGETIGALTQRTGEVFAEDMAALGARVPDIQPRATEHIPQMVDMIGTLVAKGNAYAAEGHVLFNVPSMPDYGQLSRRNRDEQIDGARVDVAPYKRDPADFVLWKPSADDQPGWDSPWGRGRPGWHIECSAMAAAHLGDIFDIHAGGIDLVFPHHENEIAQSRCAHGTPAMARYWLHNGFLMAEGEKMSKSLGNFYTPRELLEEFPGEALRYTLLSGHYRQPFDFTKEGVRQARAALDRLYGALRGAGAVAAIEPKDAPHLVRSALEDDLNTSQALAALHDLAGALNKTTDPVLQARLKGEILAGGALLGLLEQDPEDWFRWQPKAGAGLTDAEIETLIADRRAARAAKNFAEADRIRDQLVAAGVALEDKPDRTLWRREW
ncbi:MULTISPECIES: cysteine--tRNA ligase [Inquilinus]|uniref:Cysteine--tRNA ligase n=1 Tax=Inquilinus ginsengisoli TaxID=363840 RepID=A0ABU1JZ07_9PROT|nr:cysteine--tRNA ligase [Inquilinus ginsengisoli]MDR6293866.1 cysteinyl-tRNA synthetase [Inquilinus ginsengisoli]